MTKAKIITEDFDCNHNFKKGQIVTFIGTNEDDDSGYYFIDEKGIEQLLECIDFEWL